MKKPLVILSLILCLASAGYCADKSPARTPIEITAEGENRFEGGMAYASGDVVLKYADSLVYADEISYDSKSHEVIARGNVRIYTKERILRGDSITYNLETQKVISKRFYTAYERFFLSGSEITTPQKNHYIVHEGIVTTDNSDKPCYFIKANTIEVYPDDRVIVKDAVFYIENVPVMWFPYYSYSLNNNRTSYEFSAGSSGRWGVYMMNTYNWQYSPKLSMSYDVNYYSKRGPGGGVGIDYITKDKSKINFRSFWIHDWGNEIDVNSTTRPIEPPARRFRFSYQQNSELTPDVYALADINVWSDKYVTQDFFDKEFQNERQPDNMVNLVYYQPDYTASLLARSQANGLFDTTERKPEFIVEGKRQRILDSPFYYEGESSVVNFEKDFDRDNNTRSYRSIRYDTFHQILYPRQYFGWLSVTPLVGARGTVYTRSNDATQADPTSELSRYVFNTGLESSFKISRVWQDIRNDKLGIDGIRHVAEPFINYSYVPKPNVRPDEFLGYDDNLPNTVLRPLNYPAYKSIDSIDKTNTLRHGIRNKIQTKRDGLSYDLIDWSLYGDFNMERNGSMLVDSTYPELYNEVKFYPVNWMRLEVYSAAPLSDKGFSEVDSRLVWQLHPAVEARIGHSYYEKVPFVTEDSSLITVGTLYRLNENWQFSQDMSFEADNGQLEEQRYTIYRDLSAWKASISTLFRSNRDVADEFAVYFSLTLKAFPEHSLSIK